MDAPVDRVSYEIQILLALSVDSIIKEYNLVNQPVFQDCACAGKEEKRDGSRD